jgi:hypothetical protein
VNRQQQIACTLLLALIAASSAQATVDDARAKGIKWLVQTQKGDGSFVGLQGLEVQATSATVEAMLAAGMTRSPQYARALSWLANASGGSLDARAWQSVALAAAGRDAKTIAGTIRDERNIYVVQSGGLPTSGGATWGAYPGYGASTIDTALGYGALRSAGVSYTNDTSNLTVTALCNIVPAQLTGSPWSGAWPHALPQSGQPSHAATGSLAATAIMLYEFKKQRQAGRFLSATVCSKSSPGAIDTAMTSAKTWLIAQANGDGGFAERNPQTGSLEASAPVATAMAIRALALFAAEGDTAAVTAITNGRAWLDAQQNTDGSWRGDPFVTARVVAALPAAAGGQLTDSDQDGLTDVVEQQLGTQTLVADAQSQLDPNANAVPGLTATSFSVSANLNETFSYTVPASGGNGPFAFALVNGALPPGLTMAANGQISGSPSASGSYAFDYEVTDAASTKTLVIGRIDVAEAPAPSDGDVPLPAWALVALGAGLLGSMRRYAARASA